MVLCSHQHWLRVVDLRADWCFCCEALQMDHASLLKQFEHLDPHNQNTFEAKDLELLISTVTSEAAVRLVGRPCGRQPD